MTVLAHAFGERYDLPIPLYLFVIGGAVVVLASFLLVARRGQPGGEPIDAEVPDGSYLRPLHPIAGTISVVVLALLCWCGFAGSQEVPENLLPTVFWVVVWVAVPLVVALVGDWTQPVNPFAFLGKLGNSAGLRQSILGGADPVAWPRWLGWWPAAVLFFGAACAELIFNLTFTLPHVIATMLTGYAVFSFVCGLLFGAEWLRRGEMFTVLFDTWGRLGWFRFGAPGRRGFAGGLELGFARQVSRIVFVLLMLLNINFDGLLSTPQWTNDVLKNLPGSFGEPGDNQHLFNVAAFALMVVTLAALLTLFAKAATAAGGHSADWRTSVAGLLPSLVPIAFGYLVAHYLSYLLLNGQLLFPLLGNPTGHESWPITLPYPFNDDWEPTAHQLSARFYWYVAVVVIIAVHVVAVLIANRRLSAVGRDSHLARRSEYPWLVAMIGYTCLSLWLIAQPFTEESASTSGSDEEALRPPASVSQLAGWPIPNR